MKFNPDRDNSPFRYKGYEAFIRRYDNEFIDYDVIEIRLVKRHQDRGKTMIIAFAIAHRRHLFRCLHRAVKALQKAELEQACIPTN